MYASHREQYKTLDMKVYDAYRKSNVVKRKDLSHPLRAEWRRQNGIEPAQVQQPDQREELEIVIDAKKGGMMVLY